MQYIMDQNQFNLYNELLFQICLPNFHYNRLNIHIYLLFFLFCQLNHHFLIDKLILNYL